ncbi:origin recognition complex subunit 4 [Diaporthe amygdali]|uniref:origin recognition complex subunit 4 n=1 Tax=Phomopsis amygdali TaxID=1214568 RepID=UPI0022FE768C|nr:origin recognition complex subunit 4 [Diaporthe amygdali]KAJ0118088.1 origin recognition complex subunit 4 [Diaporthe amygdali]
MAPKTMPSRKRGRPRKDDPDTSSKKPRLDGRHATDRSRDTPNPDENRQDVREKNDVYDFHDPDEALAARTPSKAQPKLKGILTPSRRHSERAPKSVAFDKLKRGDVLFEDIAAKPVKSVRKAVRKRREEPEEEPEEEPNDAEDDQPGEADETDDDEVCALCSKPDSKTGNQILFCDGCDLAVHQKCYGVSRIPRGDWLCKDCSQSTSATSENDLKGKDQRISETVIEAAPEIPNFEQHLKSLKRVLLDRCTGRRRMRLRDQDEAYEKTFQLVQQTVLAGEGNSMLVIGARGCGKTTMVESVLYDLGMEHRDQFHVVRLNGFIHTDDKLALKDIWRQLGKEMEVEDDLIGKTSNYADTLASLLALLSHPSEIAESQEGVTSKSVVFIIDEFDLFATHARQTLLYNLFDIAQARKAPIAVLGLTNRIDVVESLEKRVKSRFSHRYVYLSLSKTLPAYWAVCKQGLTVEDEDAKAEGLPVTLQGFAKFQEYWTKKIEALYKDQMLKDHVEYHYYSTKSVPAFLNSCVLPLAALTLSNLSLRFTSGSGTSVDPPDSKLHLLESLSDLDLSLLISAARLDIVAHMDTVNFAMAYDEYTTLIGRQRVQSATSGMMALGGGVRVWGRGVAEICWERLVSLGLLLPTGMGGRMCKVDVTLEEIPTAVKLNAILARWCKEL